MIARFDSIIRRGLHLSICLVAFFSCLGGYAQNLPEVSNRLVTDYTNTLSESQKQELENKLVAFDDSTSTQIAVVIIHTTDGYDIADYGVRLAQKWGVGGKKNDNGLLLLVALADRAVTIQTGYGVEGAVPDAIAYQIIEKDIKPAFRANNYYQGIDQATNSLMSYTKGEYKADPKLKNSKEKGGGSITLFIIIIVIIIIVLSRRNGGNNGGGGGRVIDGKNASDIFWWSLLNGMMNGGGRSGGSGGFGGGSFGGGSSGGGFGGFGGGGFGGGGASGRW